MSASRIGQTNVALLHEPAPFSILFSLSASCHFVPTATKLKAGERMDLRGL